MASSREMHPAAAPRPALSNSSSNALPGRSGHARNSSQSLISHSLNPNHRVTRRKSVNAPNANMAAVTAHLGEKTAALPIAGRRNTFSKSGRGGLVGSLPSPPASLPGKGGIAEVTSAIDDANDLSADDGTALKASKARARRASDGSQLTKGGKGPKGEKGELTCQTCGKGYKHSSCLTKHLWEHTPEWGVTSKLLISKHQQVQLLEAATVLMKFSGDKVEGEATPPESTRDSPSDVESGLSPGRSEQRDRHSSADTTPPPTGEGFGARNERQSSISQSYSRSYQSAPGSGYLYGNEFGHSRNPSDPRPPSAGMHTTDPEDRELADRFAGMSGSLGSNHGAAAYLPGDVPPVPPMPAQYRGQQQASSFGGSFMNSYDIGRQPESFTRGAAPLSEERDVQMGGQAGSVADGDDLDMPTRTSRSDDDMVFGMDE